MAPYGNALEKPIVAKKTPLSAPASTSRSNVKLTLVSNTHTSEVPSQYTGTKIISGYINGKKFRPSNWPDRLCESGATYDKKNNVMRYAPYLMTSDNADHAYCVIADFDTMKNKQPELYDYVVWFIESHGFELHSH